MTERRALIIGSAGQDGRLLTAFLSSQNYRVIGVERNRVTGFNTRRPPIALWDAETVAALIADAAPTEIYYLASHQRLSPHEPNGPAGLAESQALHKESYAIHCNGLANVIAGMRRHAPRARLFYASSCMVFGHPKSAPQDETCEMAPPNVYAETKAIGMEIIRRARDEQGLFCASGILNYHESALRDERFVIQHIVKGAVDVKFGEQRTLILGDLRVRVDWGAAEDFVRAMHAMLQINGAQDFVIGTGELHSVGEAAELALKSLGLDPVACLRTDAGVLRRPPPSIPYQANIRAIQAATGWTPMIGFERLVKSMIEAERSLRSYQAA